MTGYAADNIAAPPAQEKYSEPSEKHSQAAQAIGELSVLVHPRMDPAFAAMNRGMLLKNMMQLTAFMQKESS